MKDIIVVFGFWGFIILAGIFGIMKKQNNYQQSTVERCETISEIKACTSDWAGVRTCSYITESGMIIEGNVHKSNKICWREKKQ